MLVGAGTKSAGERAAEDFVAAWERGDLRAMHGLLSPSAQASYPLSRFRRAYGRAAGTATLSSIDAGDPEGAEGDRVEVPVVVHTRVFGSLRGDLSLPVSDDRVEWEPWLVFPELRPGERLSRDSLPPVRATIRSRDGKVLAQGPATSRTSPLVGIADSIAGRMEPEETPAERAALFARGFPADWPVGQSGLEQVFERRLRGRPGGELVAGSARARAGKAARVRRRVRPRSTRASRRRP